ncbi:MAG: hypothetical protein ABI658_23630 [Acidimicrobiales bacterium]
MGRLDDASEKVVAYAHSNVEHLQFGERSSVTYPEFENSIDQLGKLAKRYNLLMNGATVVSWRPTVEGDSRSPFRKQLAFDQHWDKSPLDGDD